MSKKLNGALEHTSFMLVKGHNLKDFIKTNRDIDVWLKQQPGFRSRHIFQDEDGRVYDLVYWDSVNQGRSASQRLMKNFAESPVHSMINHKTVGWHICAVAHSV